MSYPKLTPIVTTGGSTPRYLADRFADQVNVLDYGVKNDGITDTTEAIQAVINGNEGRTIRFPEGTYLISSPIKTSGDPAKAQMLVFDENAILKASNSWASGDFLIEYGVLDVLSAQTANGDSYGIVGGQFDTNGRASGIFYAGPQGGQFYNNRIRNSTYIGMQVYDADTYTGSSDAWIENLFVHAPQNIGSTSQVGLVMKGTDNNVIGFRTFSGFCGVKVYSGGQYFKDAHVVGYGEEYPNYEDTVGFDLSEASYYCTFESCYADNFSRGWKLGSNQTSLTNCECFWYSNGSHSHICVEYSDDYGVFKGKINGFSANFPSNGDNYILKHSSTDLGVYNFDISDSSGIIQNLKLTEFHAARLKHPLSELACLSSFNRFNEQQSNDANTAVLDKWYPVASFAVATDVGGGNAVVSISNELLDFDVTLSINADLGWALTSSKIRLLGKNASIILGLGALGDIQQDNDGTNNTSCMLYLKYTASDDYSKTDFRVKLHSNSKIAMYRWPRNLCSFGWVSGYYEIDTIPNQIGNTVAVDSQGFWAPYKDNAISIGTSDKRFTQLYAASATISTSDAREKTSIESPSDALFRAWGKLRYKVFQFIDAVSEKGADKARMHIGLIAQDVDAAFASEGLNADRYGLFCHDEWEAEYTADTVIDTPAQYNEKGEMIVDAQTHVEMHLVRPAGDRYGIRYEEAFALECAYQRWRLEQLEERINQLTNTNN